jgi:hypothetical protein
MSKYVNEKYGFVPGFKAPGWKKTEAIEKACTELGYWMCSCPAVKVNVPNCWYTHPREGITEYKDYTEYYAHTQNFDLDNNIEELKEYCRRNNPEFKFISEMVHSNEEFYPYNI